jgi:hypothetical protein
MIYHLKPSARFLKIEVVERSVHLRLFTILTQQSISIKQSRVSYTIYKSRTAAPILMILDLLELSLLRLTYRPIQFCI